MCKQEINSLSRYFIAHSVIAEVGRLGVMFGVTAVVASKVALFGDTKNAGCQVISDGLAISGSCNRVMEIKLLIVSKSLAYFRMAGQKGTEAVARYSGVCSGIAMKPGAKCLDTTIIELVEAVVKR